MRMAERKWALFGGLILIGFLFAGCNGKGKTTGAANTGSSAAMDTVPVLSPKEYSLAALCGQAPDAASKKTCLKDGAPYKGTPAEKVFAHGIMHYCKGRKNAEWKTCYGKNLNEARGAADAVR